MYLDKMPEKIYELFTTDLKKYVSIRKLWGFEVIKYNKKAFFDRKWFDHPELEYARGIVIDEDRNIISNPFHKVYNYGEEGLGVGKEAIPGTIVQKVNGFLGVASIYHGNLLLSTTGSIDPENSHIKMFKELLEQRDYKGRTYASLVRGLLEERNNLYKIGHTVMFEVVHKDDPHVVSENIGLHLIGVRKNVFGCEALDEHQVDDIYRKWFGVGSVTHSVYRPKHVFGTLQDALDIARHNRTEGFMFHSAVGNLSVKVKTPYYLISKFMSRGGMNRLSKIWSNNPQSIEDTKEMFFEHEEFYRLYDWLREHYTSFEEWNEESPEYKLSLVQGFIRYNCDKDNVVLGLV